MVYQTLKDFLQRKFFIQNVTNNLARNFFFKSEKSQGYKIFKQETKHLAPIYDPLPVVLKEGEGCEVWDTDGKRYLDFLGGTGALIAGHSHPKIVAELTNQLNCLHLTSRTVYNNVLPKFAQCINCVFNYEKCIPMNTGAEAGETAIKLARRWGYLRKNIPENKAIVIMAENNFWGYSLAAVSSSTTPQVYQHFGPYLKGFGIVPFNNISALSEALCNNNVCAFMMEPIQGKAGVILPCDNYLREIRKLCSEKNVLWIADEVLTGLGRVGNLLACDFECVRPDILILGKGLGGGVLPISAVLSTKEVTEVMQPGTHGSTFGGNPLACQAAMATLDVIKEENLIENSRDLGQKFRCELRCRLPKEVIPIISGRGLLNALLINQRFGSARDVCKKMLNKGLLVKNCNDCTVIFTPPLIINECQLNEAIEIISDVIHSLKSSC